MVLISNRSGVKRCTVHAIKIIYRVNSTVVSKKSDLLDLAIQHNTDIARRMHTPPRQTCYITVTEAALDLMALAPYNSRNAMPYHKNLCAYNEI
jgi:hypothetical protein